MTLSFWNYLVIAVVALIMGAVIIVASKGNGFVLLIGIVLVMISIAIGASMVF